MATLRTLAKGAPLRVVKASPWFGDDRSAELDDLPSIYDNRSRTFDTSDTRTVFGSADVQQQPGLLFLGLVSEVTCWGDLHPWLLHAAVKLISYRGENECRAGRSWGKSILCALPICYRSRARISPASTNFIHSSPCLSAVGLKDSRALGSIDGSIVLREAITYGLLRR